MTPAATGDTARSAEVLRTVLQAARTHSLFGFTPIAADNPGGLATDFDEGDASAIPSRTFAQLGTWDGSVADLWAAIAAYPLTAAGSAGMTFDGVRQVGGMLEVLAAGLEHDARARDDVLRRLEPRAADGTLTLPQQLVLQRIACVPGVHLSTPLVDALWPIAEHDATGHGAGLLAEALAAQGLPQATTVQAWSDATRAADGDPRPVSTLVGLAAARSPRPAGRPNADVDRTLAQTLDRQIAAGDLVSAEAELADLRSRGRIGRERSPSLGLLWARSAAERGDAAAFQHRLSDVLDLWGWRADAQQRLDLRLCLATRSPADRSAVLVAAAVASLDRAARQWPNRTDLTRCYAVVGAWADRTGDADLATRVAERASRMAYAEGIGEHQLWVADLIRPRGGPTADQIEVALLDHRCLPASRIAPLLRTHGLSLAPRERQRAEAAREYCGEPNLARVSADR